MIGKIYKRLSAIALATLMLVPAARAEKISKHTVEGEEMWYWSTTVSVKRNEAHTFWIKDLTETTAIYGASIYGVYTWKEDGETYEDYVDVSETADLENAKGGYDHYSLFSADTWDYLPDTVKTIAFYVYVEGWGEDASAADISFTFGHASGKAYPFVKPVVTFNANGGTCDESQREVATGETVGSLPYAEKKNADFLGWYTAKTGGSSVTDDTVVTKDVTYYAHWFDYKTVTVTVGGGYASDPETGDSVTSVTTLSGNYSGLSFDWEKIRDAQGNDVGAFQRWVVSPATADLGEEFDPYSTDTTIMIPDVNVKITAQYIPVVAAYVTYELNTEGSAEENAYFYWSSDGGKTLLDSGSALPLAAGAVTVSFYAKDDEGAASAAWKAPASVKVTIPARESWTETYIDEDTGKKVKATYYGDVNYLNYREWFVAADGATTVKFDANGGSCSVASRWYLDAEYGGSYYVLPEPDSRAGYVFNGWWTSKTGGDPVSEGDSVMSSTLYAQWLQAYTFTLKTAQTVSSKGFAPELQLNYNTYENPVSVLQGYCLTVSAPESTYDENEDEYVFVKWELAKSADLGEEFNAESCETSITMPAADVTLTAKYRPRYMKVDVSVTGGFTYDHEGEQVAKATLYAGEQASLAFDTSKLYDKVGNEIGAFQRWTWEPASLTAEELGIDLFSPETSFVVPEDCTSFKLTAQYVSPVAGYVSYEFNTEGYAEEEASFYWSPDGGKTLITSGRSYPLAAGTIKALSFHAKDDYTGEDSECWKAPPSVSLTIPKRSTYKDGGVTYYYDPSCFSETEWFVAAEGAKQIFFNGNGGKCAVASRWYLDGELGGTYYTLPTPAERKGYVFAGWATSAKATPQCCGILWTISTGSEVDFSELDAKKPTLYAQWLKAYDLTLKGTDVTAEYEGGVYSKSVSVLEGGQVVLRAPESYTDAKDVTYLFQCWTPSKAYDFGEGYSASSYETTIEMPAAKLTMTATYVKESEAARMTMYATGETVEAGDVTIEPDTSKFYWSVDGKAWFQSGTQAIVKKGTYTVQWKSTSDVWTAPTTKAKVTVGAYGEYDNGDDPALFTFATTISATPVVYADGEWYESSEGGTVTMKPTDGRIPTGKTVTLTAKAAKGYAFVGWQFEKDWDDYGLNLYSSSATVPFAAYEYLYQYVDSDDYKVHVQAVFRPISDYSEDGMARVFQYLYSGSREVEPSYDEDDYSGSVEIRVGLNCSSCVSIGYSSLASPLTFKIAGTLPKGLKFDTENGYLSGTPTVAGTYPLTVTATDPAGHAATLAITLVVRSVFDPVVGDWRALLTDESGAYAGLLEMSITDKGKASAKIITATGTTSVTPTVTWTEDEDDPDGDGTFEIWYEKDTGNEKSGSYVSFSAYPSEGCMYYETETWKNYETTAFVSLEGELVKADSSLFKDEQFAASFLGKYYTVALAAAEGGDENEGYRTPSELMASGYLTITTDKKGIAKIAGKLPDGEKISASAVLLPSESGDSASALVFVVPSGYKKKGSVALKLEFGNDGVVLSSDGAWVTPPLLDAISGWDSDEEIFLPGLLSLSASGAVYSKLDDLTNYYLSLGVSTGEATPTLEYSYTDSEKTKYYERTEAVTDVEYYLTSDSEPAMLTGGKGGKITVGKSASPWKDSEGYYHYDETKEDRSGETEPIMNPGGLTISYKSATGIFSGKFNLFFDYEVPQYKNGEEIDPKLEHKSVSCSYEGVLINNGSTYGVGSAVYSGKYTYEYWVYNAKTDTEKAATKTYTQKFALPVEWTLGEGDSD